MVIYLKSLQTDFLKMTKITAGFLRCTLNLPRIETMGASRSSAYLISLLCFLAADITLGVGVNSKEEGTGVIGLVEATLHPQNVSDRKPKTKL